MPVHKKNHTTPDSPQKTRQLCSEDVTTPPFPAPEDFHQYLRAQIREVTRMVMEDIMGEELTQFVGASWGECTAERRGYRNGFYTHNLGTASGPIEDLKVPRDREGQYHTQVFERYQRIRAPDCRGTDPDVCEWDQYA